MGKWKLYVPILLGFVCLAAALFCVFGWIYMRPQTFTPADLEFQDTAHNISLVPHYNEAADSYSLFLPACTSPSDLTLTNPITEKEVEFFQRDICARPDSRCDHWR